MLPDISSKRFAILGLQGSGKTVLARFFLKAIKNSIVYDVHHEYVGYNRYMADHRQVDRRNKADPGVLELDTFVKMVVTGSGQVRLFVLDEANRFCPSHYPLPASILTLNDDQRHDKIAFGTIARRPSQLHTDLIELAHYLFIFRLTGRNDYQFLEDTAEGLGDAVKKLEDFQFVIVDPGRRFKVHEPMPYKKE
jgi:DNA helicase HerA-like ATPase